MGTEIQRAAAEELKKMRFCHICGNLVKLRVDSIVYPKIFFSCPVCGEIILFKERKIVQQDRY